MQRFKRQPLACMALLGLALGIAAPRGRACTTAVISGRATSDGRPLLWKNRDTTSSVRNEVVLLTSGSYRALAVVNAGQRKAVWMGMNEAGFCIENSLSRDLAAGEKAQGPGNGALMKTALERCATVEDFRRLLEETDATGRSTTASIGVIDAHGGAALFETGPKSYVMFDANDPAAAPHGFIVRANFSTTAQKLPALPSAEQLEGVSSGERYLRACALLRPKPREPLESEYVLRHLTRDLADELGVPYPGTVNGTESALPRFIPTGSTISRTTTVSAAVFQGVRVGEDPALTTMWTILGDPKFSIAVPCWVAAGEVAPPLSGDHGGEIGEIARTLREWHLSLDGSGVETCDLAGIWEDLWATEDRIVTSTRKHREHWNGGAPAASEIASWHRAAAEAARTAMVRQLRRVKAAAIAGPRHHAPLSRGDRIRVAIYDPSEGPARGPRNLLELLTPEAGFDSERIRPERIREGGLGGFHVLIMPGGSGSQQAEMLGAEGREAIRQFVRHGGGYVGICAGSYLASAQYSWSLGLLNARVWDRAHWARGTGTVKLALSPRGMEVLGADMSGIEVHYRQGPLLVPGHRRDLPPYEVLATYASEVAQKGAPAEAMAGTHAIAQADYGAGRVLCFSPHLEVPDGPRPLLLNGIRWACRFLSPPLFPRTLERNGLKSDEERMDDPGGAPAPPALRSVPERAGRAAPAGPVDG